jgi:hypothetical protein
VNYLLSVYANRVTGVNNVELSCSGRVVKSASGRFVGTNIKENALEYIAKGLRFAAASVKHNDKLQIEVQNRHLVDWLMKGTDNNEYSAFLDVIFGIIENMDCEYRFIYEDKPRAKAGTLSGVVVTDVVSSSVSIESLMQELEG